MTTLVLSTRNKHKAEEIRAMLADAFLLFTLNDFPNAPEVIEDRDTFAGNAKKKALELARWLASSPPTVASDRIKANDGTDLVFVLADDSGLEVDALNGAPGVHSARFAAPEAGSTGHSPDSANNAKLVRLLANTPPSERTARFRCLIALAPVMGPSESVEMEKQIQLFEGTCEGRIIDSPIGEKGFGYDPLFVPAGFDQSFAELGETVKNQISHRSQALSKLKAYLAMIPK